MAKHVSPRSKSAVPMDVVSSHGSGTSTIVHYELPTADALEAKLVVEIDFASALRYEVDMLRKQTTQSVALLKTTIKYLVYFKTKQAETDHIVKHTIFIHSNDVLVYQTFKRKRPISDRGGAQAKYLEKTPTTANIMIMLVDIAPALRRKTPIPAKSTPNPVAKSLFEPERAQIAANRTPVPFLPRLEDKAYIVVRNFACIFPSWKDYTANTEQFPVFLRNLRARTKIDCEDEQGLVALFKHSLMKYRSYLRQAHFYGKPLNEFSVKSPVLHLSDGDWNNLVTHWSRLQRKKNIHSQGTTESRNYTAHCIALVSTSCSV
ncbi:unnamed protein product [Triticum aestivum]|uniref:Uncharacterized protein n=1 Tax=Triticum aestivum TaxID=4565 RepID=A0A7H4LFS9_WHEAT|nr:unnamed protein product [Triticum aestivum]